MKSTSEILLLLEQFKPHATEKYGLTRLGVFGSVARGEQQDESDVDICYEGDALSLMRIDMLQTELESLLGSKVDTVRVRPNMNPVLLNRIRKEGLYV